MKHFYICKKDPDQCISCKYYFVIKVHDTLMSHYLFFTLGIQIKKYLWELKSSMLNSFILQLFFCEAEYYLWITFSFVFPIIVYKKSLHLCRKCWRIFILFFFFYFTILYWFCHTLTWIRHGCTWVPNPEPPSHLPPHTIFLGHPSAPVPGILCPAWNLAWWFISYMILYMF